MEKHNKLKGILIKYGNEEYGDCIIDEICNLFNYNDTISVKIIKEMGELNKAKENTLACLENGNVSVDFHGLKYWAGRVELIRKELKEL